MENQTERRAADGMASTKPGGEGRTLSIADLLHTTRELGETLAPVRPDDAFRAALRSDLAMAARRQHALWLLYGGPGEVDTDEDEMSRRLMWGAAAVGLGSAAVSVLGALAYYWRRRGRKAA